MKRQTGMRHGVREKGTGGERWGAGRGVAIIEAEFSIASRRLLNCRHSANVPISIRVMGHQLPDTKSS